MDFQVLRQYLEANKPILEAWGNFVQVTLERRIGASAIRVQISSCRVKEIDSAVGKVGRKNYKDPLQQMTDLVGVRFVVLLSPQLSTIGELIENIPDWTYAKDRDPDEEAQLQAEKFGYQSLHYIVRSAREIETGGIVIPKGLPCEIQVRTLLQHTYAEVVHDSIYKAVGKVPPKANRYVARSMALIETSDHLFVETMRLLEEENRDRNQLLRELSYLYDSKIGAVETGPDEKFNLGVIEAYQAKLPAEVSDDVSRFIEDNGFIIEKIRSRLLTDPFWLQPVSLLAYWLVQQNHLQVFEMWPFAGSHDALEKVYSDLGISVH